MKFVLAQNLTICFHPCGLSAAMIARRSDAITFARILVNPIHCEPAPRVRFVRPDEVESLWVRTQWMTEPLHVTGQEKIERFDLIAVLLSIREVCQMPHNS